MPFHVTILDNEEMSIFGVEEEDHKEADGHAIQQKYQIYTPLRTSLYNRPKRTSTFTHVTKYQSKLLDVHNNLAKFLKFKLRLRAACARIQYPAGQYK
jgi:hypothetical protein